MAHPKIRYNNDYDKIEVLNDYFSPINCSCTSGIKVIEHFSSIS
jgi:hypothetical protein